MTADIINLRLKRKAKKRDEAAEKAAENRVVFGRSKAEKRVTEFDRMKEKTVLDGKKRED
ncbi:MAG: DUF4169 family protein [Alphaproteobacteria bacterium]|nr:DUF4169 family protein [Alphaproteobacteria bacterium]